MAFNTLCLLIKLIVVLCKTEMQCQRILPAGVLMKMARWLMANWGAVKVD